MTSTNELNPNSVPTKRKRAANYTAEEKYVLLNLISKHRNIIDCRKTDAATWREKEACWQKISAEFNAQAPSKTVRSVESLKKFFENQKKQLRRDGTPDKSFVRVASGGNGYLWEDTKAEITLEIVDKENDLNDGDNANSSEHNGAQEINEHDANWGYYRSTFLNPKVELVPEQSFAPIKQNVSPKMKKLNKSKSWISRRRPTGLLHCNMSKQYSNKLSAVKLEIAQIDLQSLKETIKIKKEREKIEFDLRTKSLQLDVDIKKEILSKIKQMQPNECLQALFMANFFNIGKST